MWEELLNVITSRDYPWFAERGYEFVGLVL